MFPTTVWTDIRGAGASDPAALERVARAYRAPVLRYLRLKGASDADAEDLCQEAFVRLLRGEVFAAADRSRGRFRSLLRTVVVRTWIDAQRREKPERPVADSSSVEADPDFDREWVVELVDRALRELRRSRSPYYPVLEGHLEGRRQDRHRLWIARRKLVALIRREIALTASSPELFEEEVAYLSRYLDPRR